MRDLDDIRERHVITYDLHGDVFRCACGGSPEPCDTARALAALAEAEAERDVLYEAINKAMAVLSRLRGLHREPTP